LQRDGSVLHRQHVAAMVDDGAARSESEPLPTEIAIGRALNNDFVLDDPHVAPYHATLHVTPHGATLIDLSSVNGIVRGRKERARSFEVKSGDVFRIGNVQLRLRTLESSLAPEVPLSRRLIWPWALLMLSLVLGHAAYEMWLSHVGESTPAYLNRLSGDALAICVWSGAYALLGRLISGAERFFTHLLIASTGVLTAELLMKFLSVLAFSTSALFPLQIEHIVIVLVVAFTIRAHLRVADLRHWPTLRYAVAIVAVGAIVIPMAQKWVSHDRITDIQTLSTIHHPAFQLTAPESVESFTVSMNELKARTDALKKKDARGSYEYYGGDDD
jgi:hypothetical protein